MWSGQMEKRLCSLGHHGYGCIRTVQDDLDFSDLGRKDVEATM